MKSKQLFLSLAISHVTQLSRRLKAGTSCWKSSASKARKSCWMWKSSASIPIYILNNCHTIYLQRMALLARIINHYVTDCFVLKRKHDDVIKWKHFPRYWPFVRGIHRSPVNSLHKGQWRGALMFSLICVWINGWVNNRDAGDLRRYRAHYDVTVMN